MKQRRGCKGLSFTGAGLLFVLLLGACGGDDGEEVSGSEGSDDAGEQSEQAWFEENCPVELATTTSDTTYALTQSPMVPVVENVNAESRDEVLSFYDIFEKNLNASKVEEMTTETPFCLTAGADTVDAVDGEAGEEHTFLRVEAPDLGETYIIGDEFNSGLRFDSEDMELPDADSLIFEPADHVEITEDDLDNADPEDIDPCSLPGALCGG